MGSSDRRQTSRYATSLEIDIRFLPDGTPIKGSTVEIGPNGMRVLTTIPLVEASYVHISFQNATNNTHCEGRVVWTQPSEDRTQFESGVDIQRWGGGMPGQDVIGKLSPLEAKTDRRKKHR